MWGAHLAGPQVEHALLLLAIRRVQAVGILRARQQGGGSRLLASCVQDNKEGGLMDGAPRKPETGSSPVSVGLTHFPVKSHLGGE